MRDIRLRDSVPTAVVRLFRQFNRVHHKALKPLGLSPVQAHILSVLWLEGPMTIGQVQHLLSMGSSTLTGAVDRMEKAGLLRRTAEPGDRRAYRLEPAPWKQNRRDEVLEVLDRTQDECLACLTKAERRDLVRLLTKVSKALE